MTQLKQVTIFTDGACLGNPGPGGCAAILVYGKHRKELVQGYRWTTNNRMELMALILGLEALKYKCFVIIYTDSKYLLGAFKEKWIERWKTKGWRTKSRTDVLNIDLWKRLDGLLSKHQAKFYWVKGHSGHPENSRCDELAVAAAKSDPLLIDNDYEKINPIPTDYSEANTANSADAKKPRG
ncbi:MAG: ribonuclease HI [Desulfobacterales bacterium]|nr:ribonuclease HI [Desulfobacterales bacterium]